jgi:hypothetical protein
VLTRKFVHIDIQEVLFIPPTGSQTWTDGQILARADCNRPQIAIESPAADGSFSSFISLQGESAADPTTRRSPYTPCGGCRTRQPDTTRLAGRGKGPSVRNGSAGNETATPPLRGGRLRVVRAGPTAIVPGGTAGSSSRPGRESNGCGGRGLRGLVTCPRPDDTNSGERHGEQASTHR